MVKKDIYLKLEKQKKKLNDMIDKGEKTQKILKQSQKLDELIHKVMLEGHKYPYFFIAYKNIKKYCKILSYMLQLYYN